MSVTESGPYTSNATTNYTYDDAGKLTQEAGPYATIAYTYDLVGNRLTRTVTGSTTALLPNGATTNTYDANDRLTISGHTYDADGNETTVAGKTASYDFENHLVGLSSGGAILASYIYDADGNRYSAYNSAATPTTTTYVTDTSLPYASVVEEYTGTTPTLAARYDYGDDLIRMDRITPASTSYYLFDGLGSTRQLVGTNGTPTDTYAYDAFGEMAGKTGSTANPFLFNAQQFDQASGDYYLRARYYDQSNGRFISQDPYGGSDYDPVSLHRYLYASNDPVDRIDPSGRDDNLTSLSVAAIGVATIASEELPAIQQAGTSAEELIPQISQDAATVGESVTQRLGTDGEEFTEFYHVTTKEAAEIIRNEGIDLAKSRLKLDFGRGFYTSTDLKQVLNFAQRNSNGRFKDGYEILTFRVRTGDLTSLSGKLFSGADEEWEQFVLNGRLGQLKNTFDYVVGPLLRNPEGFVEGTEAARSSGVQISWNTTEAIKFLYESLVR